MSENADALNPEAVEASKVTDVATEVVKQPTVEELVALRAKDAELIEKLRKFEKENKGLAEKAKREADAALAEQGKYKELYEAQVEKLTALETKARNSLVDAALDAALKEAKAKSASTVKKLIDRTAISVEDDAVDAASIAAQIEALKISDPVLFIQERQADPAANPVKRAGEGDPIGGYEKELRACKTPQQINAVLAKYGKV